MCLCSDSAVHAQCVCSCADNAFMHNVFILVQTVLFMHNVFVQAQTMCFLMCPAKLLWCVLKFPHYLCGIGAITSIATRGTFDLTYDPLVAIHCKCTWCLELAGQNEWCALMKCLSFPGGPEYSMIQISQGPVFIIPSSSYEYHSISSHLQLNSFPSAFTV